MSLIMWSSNIQQPSDIVTTLFFRESMGIILGRDGNTQVFPALGYDIPIVLYAI